MSTREVFVVSYWRHCLCGLLPGNVSLFLYIFDGDLTSWKNAWQINMFELAIAANIAMHSQ